ncbi:MAG: glutamate-5-semialdehyde dehydrogenase [Planctomycetes bacterium]|nr:glutamate-5-semialdehyde dehydrogenase [Planctomycetota bacterium]
MKSELGVEEIARRARAAAIDLAALGTDVKNRALAAVRDGLERRRGEILDANRRDQEEAEKDVAAGRLSRALFRRLDLGGSKYDAVLEGLRDVERLPDPVGRVTLATRLDEGLDLYRVTCPLGVIGVIFESRPDAAVQIAALALKSSNAVILKGGREAVHSNRAIVAAIREALQTVEGMPPDAVQILSTREEVQALLDLDEWVDLIIPRGSNELVRAIQSSTRIPVLGHADGICAVYIDRAADVRKAVSVVLDAKAQYPAVCNAAETLLVHEDALESTLPAVGGALSAAGVELRADARALPHLPGARPAAPEDFDAEFLDLILAVKTVRSLDEAIDHINRHGSHHTDAIVTEDSRAAERFLSRVDSAGVYHNASTRFADGFRYGLGAEVGVSTNKTHARGPVGLEGLVIYKYRLYGSGQGVGDYGPGRRSFLHEPLDAGSLESRR